MSPATNPLAAGALLVGTIGLAAVSIWSLKPLAPRLAAEPRLRFRWILHVLAFLVTFVPLVMWPLVAFPAASVIPGAAAFAAGLRGYRRVTATDRRRAGVGAAVSTAMWVCYGLYEHQMSLWARTVVAPIRVDLELIAPLLYYSSLVLVRFARRPIQ